MKSCRSGVVFFGLGLSQSGMGHANVEALLRLVTELNAHTRFYARRCAVPGDVAGADSVLCWQTGFPFSVNLNRGYPRYSPGEYSANALLNAAKPTLASWSAAKGAGPCRGPPSTTATDPSDRTGLSDGRFLATGHSSLHHCGLRHPPAGHGLPDGRSADPAPACFIGALASDGDILRAILARLQS